MLFAYQFLLEVRLNQLSSGMPSLGTNAYHMSKSVTTIWRVSHYWNNLKPLRHLLIFANVEGAEQTPRLITAYSTSVHIHPADTQQRRHSFLVVYVYLMSFFGTSAITS